MDKMRLSTRIILSYFLILLPLVGLFYNLYILPGEITFLKNTIEYQNSPVIKEMMKRKDEVNKYAKEVIGIDEKYDFWLHISPKNLIRNKYEIQLSIIYPDTGLTTNKILESPQFQELFNILPELVESNIDFHKEMIFEYRFSLKSGNTISTTRRIPTGENE
jgi:hypothetical protein